MTTLYSTDPEWNWRVQVEGGKFRVGGWKKHTGKFYPICGCDDYQHARQICEALKGFIPGHDFVIKGVE